MTLILCAIAGLIAAGAWHLSPAARETHVGGLALAYAGASTMWCVDEVANLLEGGTLFNLGDTAVMADDALLGCLIVAAGLAGWLAYLGATRLKAQLA